MPRLGGTGAMRARFTLRFPATESQARTHVATVIRRLRRAGLTAERTGEIEVAVAEAVNNVVEHAYGGSGRGEIRLSCSLRPGRLDIRIGDTGRPLPAERLPPGLAADLAVPRAELPEGGFGWFLIRALASDVRYDRCARCNHLSLRFEI